MLFALFGLLPGSLLGGAAGLKVAGMFFGLPLEPGMIARSIVLLSMLMGVFVSGIIIVTAASTVGWLIGKMLDSAAHVPHHGILQNIIIIMRKLSIKVNNTAAAERRQS